MRVNRRSLGTGITFGVIGVVVLIALFPVLWGVFTSFKKNTEVFTWPPLLFPRVWTLEAFKVDVFGTQEWFRYLINSAIISSVTALLCVVLACLAGYGLSRFRIPAKNLVMLGIISLQMFPGPILMIPYLRLARALGLYNSYPALIMINSAFWLPLSIWLLKGFFDGIPPTMEDAALIDGCSRLRAVISVVIPLARAGIIAIATLTFVRTWNEFIFAYILTEGQPDVAPVTILLTNTFGRYGIHWNTLMALTTMSMIPLLVIFILLQRYIISGIMGGAIKG